MITVESNPIADMDSVAVPRKRLTNRFLDRRDSCRLIPLPVMRTVDLSNLFRTLQDKENNIESRLNDYLEALRTNEIGADCGLGMVQHFSNPTYRTGWKNSRYAKEVAKLGWQIHLWFNAHDFRDESCPWNFIGPRLWLLRNNVSMLQYYQWQAEIKEQWKVQNMGDGPAPDQESSDSNSLDSPAPSGDTADETPSSESTKSSHPSAAPQRSSPAQLPNWP
jgi:hypothetical protein